MSGRGDHPTKLKQIEISRNYDKWIRYKNKWYNPLEWNVYKRSTLDRIDSEELQHRYANELLHEARESILAKSSMGNDVTKLLMRYFEFEKRVIKWLEEKVSHDELKF
jgi:hypothetical protein